MSALEKAINESMALIGQNIPRYVLKTYGWILLLIVISIILMILTIVALCFSKKSRHDVKKTREDIQNIRQQDLLNIKRISYKKICDALTQNSSFNIGEYCVRKEIEKAIEKKNGYYLVNDVVIYNYGEGFATQIDHVLITPYGIFTLETKYWKGDTYILDINPNNIFEPSATYNNKLIINMKDGEANLYRPNTESNVIKQTVEHAVRLKKELFGTANNFVKGILVFVENDSCKVRFSDCVGKEYNVNIMSLNNLIHLIKEDKLEAICNELMDCRNGEAIYREVLRLSRTK